MFCGDSTRPAQLPQRCLRCGLITFGAQRRSKLAEMMLRDAPLNLVWATHVDVLVRATVQPCGSVVCRRDDEVSSVPRVLALYAIRLSTFMTLHLLHTLWFLLSVLEFSLLDARSQSALHIAVHRNHMTCTNLLLEVCRVGCSGASSFVFRLLLLSLAAFINKKAWT